jgi:hypothetical protein
MKHGEFGVATFEEQLLFEKPLFNFTYKSTDHEFLSGS